MCGNVKCAMSSHETRSFLGESLTLSVLDDCGSLETECKGKTRALLHPLLVLVCSREVGGNDHTLWCRWSHDHTLWCRWSHNHILWCRWSHDHTLWCRCKHVQPLHRLSTSLLTFANVKCSLPAANKGTLDSSWIYTGTYTNTNTWQKVHVDVHAITPYMTYTHMYVHVYSQRAHFISS